MHMHAGVCEVMNMHAGCSDETYAVHVECINVLLVLLSIQLSHSHPVTDSRLYHHVVNGNWYGGYSVM